MIDNRIFVLKEPFKTKFRVFLKIVRIKYPNVKQFETLRTLIRQKQLVATGVSWTLNSYHLKGLAADFVFIKQNKQPTWIGNYAYLHYIGAMCGMTPIYYKGKLIESCHLQDNGKTIKQTLETNSNRYNKSKNKTEQKLLHKVNDLFRKKL